MITIKEYTEQLETENRTLYEDKNYWKKLAEKRKGQLQQKENIIKEVREEVRIYEEQSNDGITNELDNYVFVQRLKNVLDKEVN